RDEVVRVGVLVVLDALHERARAVADADDRDADLVASASCLAVGRSHGFLSSEPLGERLDDQDVDVAFPLGRACGQLVLQLRRHAQEYRAALPGFLARAAALVERDRKARGEDADGDVVEAAAASPDLVREQPLQLTGHPDEHMLARWS